MKVLKQLRKARNLGQVELAEILGVSRGIVSQYENGHRMPGREILLRMASFFGCSIDDLLNEDINAINNTNKNSHLLEARLQHDLTAADVAKAINVPLTQYTKWENGEEYPTTPHIERLADFFKVSSSYFLGGRDNIKNDTIKEQADILSLIEFIESGKSRREFYNKLTDYGKSIFFDFLLMGKEELASAKATAKLCMNTAERHALVYDEIMYYINSKENDTRNQDT